MTKKPSVSGLQNIGTLLARNEAVTNVPPVKTVKVEPADVQKEIVKKTMSALSYLPKTVDFAAHGKYVKAAVREAYDQGHAAALKQNELVQSILDQQYKSRNANVVPAVVAAVMEQIGMHSLSLDLGDVATVFERVSINYEVAGETVSYTLEFKSDKVQ